MHSPNTNLLTKHVGIISVRVAPDTSMLTLPAYHAGGSLTVSRLFGYTVYIYTLDRYSGYTEVIHSIHFFH